MTPFTSANFALAKAVEADPEDLAFASLSLLKRSSKMHISVSQIPLNAAG